MFIWDFVADKILGQIVDWFYGQVVGFLGNFFSEMGSMGAELFEMNWVQSVVLFFSFLGWALFATGLVVAVFECGIEYAAYHDEGHHPHIHMMAWSDDPKAGFLTQKGVASIRSKMTNEIFRDEMTELYIRKDAAYKESIQTAKALLLERIRALETGAADDPGLVKELQELSQALAQVGGKHVYSYLPKSVKAQVDAIVERLAQLPEVAACYDQWWKLKDEIAGYYGRNTPPRQPLTQRKEFRSLKNWIIRETEDISFSPSADSVEPGEKQSTEKTPPIRGSVDVQSVGETVSARHIPANAVMRLLHHMGQIFRASMPVIPPALRIDSKRRRRLQEKRMALGHKRDDHEDERLHHVNDNTM